MISIDGKKDLMRRFDFLRWIHPTLGFGVLGACDVIGGCVTRGVNGGAAGDDVKYFVRGTCRDGVLVVVGGDGWV